MATRSSRLLNLGLHFTNLGTRFLFIFFLAKFLDPASVGYYGIFAATVGYCIYFVGLDFYTYVTREILKVPPEQRGRLLKSQLALTGVLYLFFAPFALAFLSKVSWPNHLLLWFFPILVFEHVNQEISRLLIALSEQLAATLVLFVRQGSWALAAVGLMTLEPETRNLGTVMKLWACAGFIASMFGYWKLRALKLSGWKQPIDWPWVKNGLAVSAAFLIATLALRGIQTFDRYWLEVLVGIETVAAYVLLLGIASTLLVFLDAGIFSFIYPTLIKLNQEKQYDAARIKIQSMLYQTLVLSAAFALASWQLLPYFISWIDNPAYSNELHLYPWLLLATALNALSMVPHFALYARGEDNPIIFSHLLGLLSFLLSTWILSKSYPALAVPLGLCFAFLVILFCKASAYIWLDKQYHN